MNAAAPITLRGLAWDHRRATAPAMALTEAFRRIRSDVSIEWTVRPLSDFEHQPIRSTAEAFDLVILDHPFCGDIAASGAFLPLEEKIPDRLGAQADGLYVGPSLTSYRYAEHVWAAPIDAATAHGLSRPDLMERLGETAPASWAEAVELGRRLRRKGLYVALPVPTPHAFSVTASLMANLGRPIATDPAAPMHVDRGALSTAIDAISELLAFAPPETLTWNSIRLHESLQARDDVAFSPCVYGYATHGEADQPKRLGFSDFCGLEAPFAAGSMLGGTGLAASAFGSHAQVAFDFIEFCVTDAAQRDQIAAHHGQPALRSACADAGIDAAFSGYFSSVRSSMELAWVRPRHRGYPRFQAAAGLALEQYFNGELDKRTAMARIADLASQSSPQSEPAMSSPASHNAADTQTSSGAM